MYELKLQFFLYFHLQILLIKSLMVRPVTVEFLFAFFFSFFYPFLICPNIICGRTKNNVDVMANAYEFVFAKAINCLQ